MIGAHEAYSNIWVQLTHWTQLTHNFRPCCKF